LSYSRDWKISNQDRVGIAFTYDIGFGAKKAQIASYSTATRQRIYRLITMTKTLFSASLIRFSALLFTTCFSLFMTGCQSKDPNSTGIFQAHRVDIPQGNYITKEMLAQVTLGMSQQQVKFALGAPLLTPVFSSDRWDYVFRHQFANGTSDLKRVVIRFKDAKVAVIEADELPTQAAPSGPTPSPSGKVGS
jgi:outer membrane protein assembly factor BamE (lipoprotein component of BamABCDE complex)